MDFDDLELQQRQGGGVVAPIADSDLAPADGATPAAAAPSILSGPSGLASHAALLAAAEVHARENLRLRQTVVAQRMQVAALQTECGVWRRLATETATGKPSDAAARFTERLDSALAAAAAAAAAATSGAAMPEAAALVAACETAHSRIKTAAPEALTTVEALRDAVKALLAEHEGALRQLADARARLEATGAFLTTAAAARRDAEVTAAGALVDVRFHRGLAAAREATAVDAYKAERAELRGALDSLRGEATALRAALAEALRHGPSAGAKLAPMAAAPAPHTGEVALLRGMLRDTQAELAETAAERDNLRATAGHLWRAVSHGVGSAVPLGPASLDAEAATASLPATGATPATAAVALQPLTQVSDLWRRRAAAAVDTARAVIDETAAAALRASPPQVVARCVALTEATATLQAEVATLRRVSTAQAGALESFRWLERAASSTVRDADAVAAWQEAAAAVAGVAAAAQSAIANAAHLTTSGAAAAESRYAAQLQALDAWSKRQLAGPSALIRHLLSALDAADAALVESAAGAAAPPLTSAGTSGSWVDNTEALLEAFRSVPAESFAASSSSAAPFAAPLVPPHATSETASSPTALGDLDAYIRDVASRIEAAIAAANPSPATPEAEEEQREDEVAADEAEQAEAAEDEETQHEDAADVPSAEAEVAGGADVDVAGFESDADAAADANAADASEARSVVALADVEAAEASEQDAAVSVADSASDNIGIIADASDVPAKAQETILAEATGADAAAEGTPEGEGNYDETGFSDVGSDGLAADETDAAVDHAEGGDQADAVEAQPNEQAAGDMRAASEGDHATDSALPDAEDVETEGTGEAHDGESFEV
jgi:hypothetical protein